MASKFFNSVATYSSCKEAFETARTGTDPLQQTVINQGSLNQLGDETIPALDSKVQSTTGVANAAAAAVTSMQNKLSGIEKLNLKDLVDVNTNRSTTNKTNISTLNDHITTSKTGKLDRLATIESTISDLNDEIGNNKKSIDKHTVDISGIIDINLYQDTRLGGWDDWRDSHDNVKNPTKAGEAFQNIDNIPYDTLKSTQNTFLQNSKFEANRIIAKQQELKDAEQNEDRLILIRQSEQSKRNKYILLIVIFVFVFVIGFFLTYVQQVNKQHSVLFDGIMVVLIAASLIYAFIVYMDIQNRDPNDFSKLHPNASQLQKVDDADITSAKYSVNANSGTDLTQTGCVGEACCSNGTKWHNSKCET